MANSAWRSRLTGITLAGLLLGLPASSPHAEDWGPPLHGPLRITGTFGEPRTGHLHTGLDLSTGREIGRPVLAIAAGYIVRMRAKAGGYGRALYLQTDRGELVVVAHLDLFAPELERHLKAEQKRAGEFEVDLYLSDDRLRFARGDTLGYSGASGAGPPHLHIEIRKGDQPVNPLIIGLQAEDHDSPQLGPIRLRALSAESLVNVQDGERAIFDTDETVRVWGEVGVEVAVIDRCGTSGARLSPLHMHLDLDQQLLFSRQFVETDFSRGAEVGRIYGRGFPENRTWVVRMYAWPSGAAPDIAASGPTSGRIDFSALSAGDHCYCLEASDASGNTTEVTWKVRAESPILPVAWRAQTIPGQGCLVGCKLSRPAPVAFRRGEEVHHVLTLGDGWFTACIAPGVAAEATLYDARQDCLLLPMALDGRSFDRIEPESLRIAIAEGALFLDVRPAGAWPGIPRAELELKTGATVALASRGITARGGWGFGLDPGDLIGQASLLRLRVDTASGGKSWDVPLEDLGGFLHDPLTFGEITLQPGSATFAAPTALRVRVEDWSCGLPDSLRPVSPPISIEPEWWPLAEKMEIALAAGAIAPDADPAKCGLYRLEEEGEWGYEGPIVSWRARIGRCGRFAVLEDRIAPVVLETTPGDGVLLSEAPVRLNAKIEEIGCGFAPRDADIYLNGQLLLAEWDIDEERLSVRLDGPLQAGHHTWEVRILDRAGNTCSRHFRFRIAPN